MKQIIKLILIITAITSFPVVEMVADSNVKKEIMQVKKEYSKLKEEYQEFIKYGIPDNVLQRKVDELAKLQERIDELEGNGASTKKDISVSEPKKANPNEEVTLTVSSDGATKDDALKNALRIAIEQAYGTFVSANTTILNDELVKDEIVTVSNGSIKDFKEVSSFEKPDGSGYMMTVNATVSLPHLITYAKNHGSECEFAGNTFGMELKLFNLQKENELKALYNMIPVIENLAKTTTKWELNIREPALARVHIEQGAYIDLGSSSDISAYYYYPDSIFTDCTDIMNLITNNSNNICALEMDIQYDFSDGDNTIYKYMEESFNRIALDPQTAYKYNKMGMQTHCLDLFDDIVFFLDKPNSFKHYCFRSSVNELNEWLRSFKKAIDRARFNFKIIDNTNQISDAYFYELSQLRNDDNYKGGEKIYLMENSDMKFQIRGMRSIFEPGFCPVFYGINGVGLFRFPFMMRLGNAYIKCKSESYDEPDFGVYRTPENRYLLLATIFVPLSEISKYSSFKVVSKD